MKKNLLKAAGYSLAKYSLGLILFSGVLQAQVITPANITSGFNQDIIANGVGNASQSTTMSFDQTNTRALVSLDFQATSSSAAPTYGLPANGTIASAATSGVNFQLAGYSGNNALFLTPSYVGNSAPNTGTLSFSASNVSTVYILAGATGGGIQYQTFTANVLFSDNTSQSASLTVSDWYDGINYAIQGIGRVNTANNNLEGSSTNPRLYEVALDLNAANYGKTITGITFTFGGSQDAEWASEIRLSVLAVSTQAAPAVPATVTVATQNNVPAAITTNGGTLQLVATVTPSSQPVTWSITQGGVLASVSATGVVTAIYNGSITVRAALSSDSTIYDDTIITISNQVTSVTGVSSAVEDDAAAEITTDGGTLQLTATVAPANATNTNVTWAVTSGSEYASVDENGLVTALANGTVIVTVTTVDGSFTDTVEIEITGQAIAVTGVTVSVSDDLPATITSNEGTLQLIAGVLPTDATNTEVTWAITTGGEFATIDENGLVTAVANGTVTVTVTSADGSFTDTIEIVITGQTIAVTGIIVTVENNAEAVITVSEGTLQLIAAVMPADATNVAVTWSVTTGSEFVSVSETGVVTAIANGTATVRATSADGTVYGEITITVNIAFVGIEDFNKNTFTVYPNPTEGIINIKTQGIVKAVYVYDSLGKEIFISNEAFLNIAAFGSGIYLVKAEFEDGTSNTVKIIKK